MSITTTPSDLQESTPATAPLSVVIPLFNEQDSVGPLVERTNAALADYPDKWELLLVDDGSSDDTVKRGLPIAGCAEHHACADDRVAAKFWSDSGHAGGYRCCSR